MVEKPTPAALPTELWVEIFSHLEYFDLLSCMRLNKAARYATQHPVLDVKLWRRREDVESQSTIYCPWCETCKSIQSLVSGSLWTQYCLDTCRVLHPSLRRYFVKPIGHHHSFEISYTSMSTSELQHLWKCSQRLTSSAADTMAAYPALQEVSLYTNYKRSAQLRLSCSNPNGITVFDVAHSLRWATTINHDEINPTAGDKLLLSTSWSGGANPSKDALRDAPLDVHLQIYVFML